jgi:hypothetical protein
VTSAATPESDTPDRPRPGAAHHSWLPIAALCLAYTVVAWLGFAHMGLAQRLGEVTFDSYDSKGYLELARFFTGRAEPAAASLIALRPFVYPLFLTLHFSTGIAGFVLLQWCANLVTLTATFASVRRATGSQVFGLLASLLLALHPTFSFIALHALTESLASALLSIAVYGIVRSGCDPRGRFYFLATILLAAATCAKPIYLPFFVVWLLYAAVTLARARRSTAMPGLWIPLAVSPILVQLFLSLHFAGTPTISNAGAGNFEERFFPAVHRFATTGKFVNYKSDEARAADAAFPGLSPKLAFVLSHPGAALRAESFLLAKNLTEGSSFVRSPSAVIADPGLGEQLDDFAEHLNSGLAFVHIAGVLGVAGLLWRAGREERVATIALLAILSYSTLVLTTLTYWQGDRLILSAAPAWIVLYACLLARIRRSVPPAPPPTRVA